MYTNLLSGAINTRPILEGNNRYIRSDVPTVITDKDKEWLLNNNIRTIIDLRTKEEQDTKPCPLMYMEEFEYYTISLSGGRDVPATPELVPISYMDMVDGQMDKVMDIAINATSNVLYFCNMGKDRTGVVSAILLMRLGKSIEYIIEDYIKTYEKVESVLKAYVSANPETDINVITPKREHMETFLEMYTDTINFQIK